MLKPGVALVFSLTTFLFAVLLLDPAMAHAYVGPSAAIGFFSAAFGFVFALFSAIFVVLLWPIKLLVRKIRASLSNSESGTQPARESN